MDSRFHENVPDHAEHVTDVDEPRAARPRTPRAQVARTDFDSNSYHGAAIVRAEAVRLDMLYPRMHR